MAGEQGSASLEQLLGEDNRDVEALERLEARVLEIVEQLRETRARQLAAEKDVELLRHELAEKDRLIEKLEAERSDDQTSRKAVRGRIESLLERVESLEQS